MSLVLRNRTPFHPFRLLEDDLLGWSPFRRTNGQGQTATFTPRFDVKETEEALLVSADLPGIPEENVSVTLDNQVLTIKGERSQEDKKEGETFYIFERAYGSFERAFRLPEHADGNNISASLKNGVLELVIPKRAESKPKKIL